MMTALRLLVLLLVSSATAYASIGGGPFVSGIILGAEGNDAISKMTRLDNGDFAVCGSLPLTSPWGTSYGYDSTHAGGWDAFVAILDNDLTTVKHFTFIGGPQDDFARGIDD